MTEQEIQEFYEVGKTDLINYRSVFIPSEDDVEPAPFHFDWSDILLHGEKNFAIEGFRESAKGQVCIRAHTLYRLTYPSKKYDYIIFIMSSQTIASKKLKEIQREYLENPFISSNLVRVLEKNENAFEVDVTDENGETINVRIEAKGKGTSVRGASHFERRPKLVVIDDPQDLEDSYSEQTLKNDYDWFMSDIFFLGKTCRIFMIGNNLGANCIIEKVFAEHEKLGFEVRKIPILDENEKSTWEKRFSTEDILAEREAWREMGKLDIWYQNKMCLAISPDDQIFKKENFRYYESLPKGEYSYYITVDLAISQNTNADYTALCVLAVNPNNHWFVEDIDYGRYDPTETMDRIFSLVSRYRPIKVGIEKVAFQAAMKHYIEKEMPRRNIFFTMVDLQAQRKKELRIAAMQPRFRAGNVWFKQGAHYLPELEMELMMFTMNGVKVGLHDDLMDALAYMEQIALPPTGFSEDDDWLEDCPYGGQW